MGNPSLRLSEVLDHFGANLRHLTEQLIYRAVDTSKYQQDILTDDENYHGPQHIYRICWHLAVLISNSLKALNLVKNGNFSILCLFCQPFLLP